MISEKMIELTRGNSTIRAMFEEGGRLAAEFGRENVYDFSLGNPSFPPPEAVRGAIRDILDVGEPPSIHGYMANAGFPAVREAVAQSLNALHGTSFTSGNIIMSVGAAGGLNVVLKTLLNPGDEVIAVSPYFVEYGNYTANYGGRIVAVPAERTSFRPDPESLAAAVTSKTKAVILNSPNNPTGVIYPAETIAALAEALEKKQKELGAPIYILSDEPYRELVYDGSEVPYITKYYRNTIVCYSWSKSLSLPGERIGYIAIPNELDDYRLIFDAACIATRVLGFVNAPSLMQLAVARCLGEKTDIAAYGENRRLLYDGLSSAGFECVYPQGAFYMWVAAPNGDDAAFTAAAKKHNILVVPGASFACPGYVRIAYCVPRDVIERSLPAFAKLARELGIRKD
ncbi:MAG: pyridoxal phosphate-dependent aminotransferase [Oscillospiraceae bacterium]|jgi:aspartate aminotransferase|nr:pyridoxal phosphate-dependent aminotransferase [Oscillospiraceae bacterium]